MQYLAQLLGRLSPQGRKRLAALIRQAIDVEEMLPAWTITIQLMGNDLDPDDDEDSVKRKLNVAANKLVFMTGAKNLKWKTSPKASFSFRFPSPEMSIEITLDNDDYMLRISQSATTSRPAKALKTLRGLQGDQLRSIVERETGVRLGSR